MNLSLNNNLGLGYVFSYDRDLKYSNLEGINIDLKVNNFISNFYYFTEDNDFGNSENITNKTSYALNEENFLSFKTSKDLVDNFTQFYDFKLFKIILQRWKFRTKHKSFFFNKNYTFH